jgi:hypothetical protein
MFGLKFTSRLAFRLANLSGLGFLGFLGFVPLPGWEGCFGFTGFFGLIGLASAVELISRKSSPPSVRQMAFGLVVVPVTIGVLVIVLHFARSHFLQRNAALRQEASAVEARAAAAAALPTHLVPQSAVDSARASLARAKARFGAGVAVPTEVVEAEQYLRWADAMFAGDRVGAAQAKIDGAKQRLALLKEQYKSGAVSNLDLAPVERELAEAETALAELLSTDHPSTPAVPPSARK